MSRSWIALVSILLTVTNLVAQDAPRSKPLQDAFSPDVWRAEKRIIDLHLHIETSAERLDRAVRILDQAGVGLGVMLGAGTVTHKDGELSDFEKARSLANEKYPGRFMQHMLLDYNGWSDDDWSDRAVKQIEDGHKMGASGLKEFKRLGLFLKDRNGMLLKIDDPKLDPVWKRCGELNLPVSIHVADPRAFWLPYDDKNERWTELKDHRSWWFGDAAKHPPRMDLLEALSRVVAKHPKTTFIGVHFANNSEDLDWVEQQLDTYPNFYADLAARVPELGRHDPAKVRKLFTKHQDRILFATDFMVYNKLILGSGGDAERPTDDDAVVFYRKHWRWLETDDRDWAHMTPIQGDWTISSIKLPPEVLRKIYFDNARRLFARSIPLPTLTATHIARDFAPDGVLDELEWSRATPVRLEYGSFNSVAQPMLSTPVKALWSDKFLYLSYECPFTELNVFQPKQTEERIGLWDNDVVEAFIGSKPDAPNQYTEFQWAPNGEFLDLKLDLPKRDFPWSSQAESVVKVDDTQKVWRVETRIPLAALGDQPPQPNTKWKINLYRHDKAHKAGLAFSPTLKGSFHTPERFGWLVFVK
jgi:predicted TIM-barrel fold metal-dependent hydrolase